MALETILTKDIQTVAVLCWQWGDSGKGKIVDALSTWADVIARGTGGPNAGHTSIVNGKELILHLIPSGITGDRHGKQNIIGNGTVIDLDVLMGEMQKLDQRNISYHHLLISQDAHVIMPYHIARDQQNKSLENGGIGSTGRGIGPCYADKAARQGIKVEDLYNRDALVRKITAARARYQEQSIDVEAVLAKLSSPAEKIKPFVADTIAIMHEYLRQGKRILLEGAQGLLLSIDYGTYPYVTASDPSINGTAAGVGISAKAINLPLGLVKFPFMTRVGGGPFPTELGGGGGEEYCRDERRRKRFELEHYEIPFHEESDSVHQNSPTLSYDHHHSRILQLMNSPDELQQAVGIRLAAGEFGATTGRPRRIGWTDAEAARYAFSINGGKMILMKPDCLAGIDEFKVGFGYKDASWEEEEFTRNSDILRGVHPQYKRYSGYGGLRGIERYTDFPVSLQQAITDLESYTRAEVCAVSTGPRREEIIVK